MKKITTTAGHIAYEVTAAETHRLGGLGICDDCNANPPHGYLISVMNHFQCPECFEDWCNRTVCYDEDAPIEAKNAEYYELMIPLEA